MLTNKRCRVSQKSQSLDGGYILKTKEMLKNNVRPFLSRSWINFYNSERMGMID